MTVNEIFYSLQGEGRWTGTPAIFVRFSGCNLRCPFCDTDHSVGFSITEDELVRRIEDLSPARFVAITGGEPSLQLTSSLVSLLHDRGYFVAVETNGTHPLPDSVDWITCSPKFDFCDGATLSLPRIDELKVVYRGAGQNMSVYDSIDARFRYLQPCDVGNLIDNRRIISETITFIKDNPTWKLSLQTQKILDIR